MSLNIVDKPVDLMWDKQKVMKTTFTMQCIFFSISMILLLIRSYQLYIGRNDKKYFASIGVSLLNISPIIMMILNAIYLFFHLTNYHHGLYNTETFIDCKPWYPTILYSQMHGRMFMYIFLMVRSSLSFYHSLFHLDIKIVIGLLVLYIISTEISLGLLAANFVPWEMFPGYCHRQLNDFAKNASDAVILIDLIMALIALIIFWYKSVQLCRFTHNLAIAFKENSEKNSKSNATVSEITSTPVTETNQKKKKTKKDVSIDVNMYDAFQKHILLGVLTCVGSVLTFIGLQIFSVCIGLTFSIDVTMNNLLIFLMFNTQKRLYNIICCNGCGLNKSKDGTNLSLIINESTTKKMRSEQSKTVNESSKKASKIELHIH